MKVKFTDKKASSAVVEKPKLDKFHIDPSSHIDSPTPINSSKDPLIGEVLKDRYRIIEKIGAGSNGGIYCAEDENSGSVVAIKIAPISDIVSIPQANKFLKREGDVLKNLDHKNIIKILDSGEIDGRNYLVLEYVPGITLEDELADEGRLSWEQTKPILEQMCHALAAVHEEGFVHCDIKPANILLGTGMYGPRHVTVLDFGFCVQKFWSDKIIAHGTIQYISPEQISGQKLDERTDIYSLGVVIYRMICGALPFNGSDMTILANHLEKRPKWPDLKISNLGIQLSSIVMKALEKNPDDRFQSISEMLDAISKCNCDPSDDAIQALRQIGGDKVNDEVAFLEGCRMYLQERSPSWDFADLNRLLIKCNEDPVLLSKVVDEITLYDHELIIQQFEDWGMLGGDLLEVEYLTILASIYRGDYEEKSEDSAALETLVERGVVVINQEKDTNNKTFGFLGKLFPIIYGPHLESVLEDL